MHCSCQAADTGLFDSRCQQCPPVAQSLLSTLLLLPLTCGMTWARGAGRSGLSVRHACARFLRHSREKGQGEPWAEGQEPFTPGVLGVSSHGLR